MSVDEKSQDPIGLPKEINKNNGYYLVGNISSIDSNLFLYYNQHADSFRILTYVSLDENNTNAYRPEEVLKHVSFSYINYFFRTLDNKDYLHLWYEFEYVPCGNLYLYLNYMKNNENNKISALQKLIIVLNSLYSLAMLHSVPNVQLIHRNISPEVICLSYDWNDYLFKPLISGFNNSRVLPSNGNDDLTKHKRTKYSAPELLNNDYTTKADVYSLGVVLYQVITGEELYNDIFDKSDDTKKCNEIKFGIPEEKVLYVPDLYHDLLEKMLEFDPNNRYCARKAIYLLNKCVANNIYKRTSSSTIKNEEKLTQNEYLIYQKYYQKGELEIENIKSLHINAHRNPHGTFEEVHEIYQNRIAPWAFQQLQSSFLQDAQEHRLKKD